MSAFSLDRVPQIESGPGRLDELGSLAQTLFGAGGTLLLVADPAMIPLGHASQAAASLKAAGYEAPIFAEFQSDPTTAQTDAAVALARQHKAKAVVALGGGSALDLGKAVAAIAPGDAPSEAYQLCARPFPSKPLGKICVPTTSGTGSEATRTAVLANSAHVKVWLWGAELKADVILLDPNLTVGLPPFLTAATGIDALVHALEACTNGNATSGNSIFCHAALGLVAKSLEVAVAEPSNLAARSDLQLAAVLAGVGIDNCGTAVAHNIGHALASLRPVHHGRAVGLALMATLAWNIETDDGRFAAAAEALGWGRNAKALPDAFEALLRRVGVKVSLTDEGYDISPDQLAAQMARPENEAMRRANFRPIKDADLLSFARRLLAQA